jgi:hypothetical protein
VAKVHPPDGEHENWWPRLSKALGTTSSDFTNAALFQIQAACRSPWGGISELSMNASLAMIEAAAPKDEIEGALAVQMDCTHTAAMAILAKLDIAFATERRIAAFGSAAARLMRAYAMQVEVLRRLRHGEHQVVRVEHVHVNDGGQAVIGNVKDRTKGAVPRHEAEWPDGTIEQVITFKAYFEAASWLRTQSECWLRERNDPSQPINLSITF